MVNQKIKELRERIQRRETAKRAKRRAKARRIKRGKPEGATETAQVKAKQTSEKVSETTKETQGLAADAKQLISTELGLSESQSESFIKEASDMLDGAGDALGDLDLNGDGDTDLLTGFDQPLQGPEESGASEVIDPTEPLLDFGEMTEPVMSDLDLEDPIEDEIFK
jgi:ATPase subunit of ABC transporter with duplicated ATPase domains